MAKRHRDILERWLDVEIIEEDVEAYLEALDEACYIPKPRKVSLAKAVAA